MIIFKLTFYITSNQSKIMIDKDTVFVLGAGASEPYEYPLGEELRTNIVDNLRQNRSKRKEIIDLNLGYSEKES
ncbi:MAG: hypothetical protein A4E25_01943 [Methanobacterium sp. PtaB.Bin024]|nr:MAG: hypothetical protein A4E25_01943 [Methanobacterium sp. PtaB.Bin024]